MAFREGVGARCSFPHFSAPYEEEAKRTRLELGPRCPLSNQPCLYRKGATMKTPMKHVFICTAYSVRRDAQRRTSAKTGALCKHCKARTCPLPQDSTSSLASPNRKRSLKSLSSTATAR